MLPGVPRNILPLCLMLIRVSLKGLLSRSYDNRALNVGFRGNELRVWLGILKRGGGWELNYPIKAVRLKSADPPGGEFININS